ncbi:MAG TPA: sigma 54-interacting transcriptional regulator [Polyangiaceae bacterium]|nr:sigma 54-interacting transcriptional regulator [Polyangiaceae bacterium]
MTPELPARYEPLKRLGQGGGGEVWAVRDRHGGSVFALKVLAEDSSEPERAALVREAAALSGLEGLGLPRVVSFGRLPKSGRAFLVRELVEGVSLDSLIQGDGPLQPILEALVRAADQLTVLHRAGLLHGDVKPANIIVEADGATTFVDLGLAAPFQEGGTAAEGLSPRYAAPELFEGKPLTVRAEVYALGVALKEAVEQHSREGVLARALLEELSRVAAKATSASPLDRYPSVDEFGSALRHAAGLPQPTETTQHVALWPILGTEGISQQLLERASSLPNGALMRLSGPAGAGKSALLRRLSWSLGVEGQPVAFFDGQATAQFIASEFEAHPQLSALFVLVDDTDDLPASVCERLLAARAVGARLIVVGGQELGPAQCEVEVPPLDFHSARDLVKRAIPSLGEALQKRVIELAGGRPGPLRSILGSIESEAIASATEIERVLSASPIKLEAPEDPLQRAVYYLDRGRYNDAQVALDELPESIAQSSVAASVARARLELCTGESASALARLAPYAERAESLGAERNELVLYLGRAYIAVGEYAKAIETLAPLIELPGSLALEALSYHGLGLSLLGDHEAARRELSQAVSRAKTLGDARAEAVALASQGMEFQRSDHVDDARRAYEGAIVAAERAGDAGNVAVVRANLAGLLKICGDVAGAIEQFEAALDMSRRSGRRQTARQALLNLANLDLYLGRLARARERIEALELQRAQLPPVTRAQLLGLWAEFRAKQGELEPAVEKYEECALAYEALGRGVDAAEARLEGVLTAVRLPHPDVAELARRIEAGRAALGQSLSHRPLLLLAQARVATRAADEATARARLGEALAAARESGQREWCWRALEARAALEESGGQPLLARRDREEAVAILEEIGARLPRDLREVYWNDARRSQLRGSVPQAISHAATEYLPFRGNLMSERHAAPAGVTTTSLSDLPQTPLEQRLARILDVNAELAQEADVGLLTARIIDHALELSRAERGLLILRGEGDSLTIQTSRASGNDVPDPEFSRSIAERVLASREPFVALSAKNDARIAAHASVHQLLLESVACLPVLAPSGRAVGALYLETRLKQGARFERELPILKAFAVQVAIALENARLLGENRKRADELADSNRNLEQAQERLRELLGDRTEQLRRARRRLKDVRDTLYGHFGYHGLVGTSSAMRRVYALIDRVKDTDVPVLITGESGTGKEMVARAIHATSPRAKAKMLGVNCGAIPENLLESELFGHVRGAFTGADRERKGLFREADGGTILLDEIGETPAKMQAGLLRVLQERKVRPVGGGQEETVDVRLVCATNRDLLALVREGKFREDLFYRIHVVEVKLPALRERLDDLPQLMDHFLGIFAARYKREKKSVSREALRVLSNYEWPGNVRELENVLLNAWVMSEDDELLPEDFSLPEARAAVRKASEVTEERPVKRAEKGTTSEHHRGERERILEALKSCNWNRVKAAQLSGIPRRTFYRRLREYGIQ